MAATIGGEPDSAGSAFNRVDEDLARAIGHTSDRFNHEAGRAGQALSAVDVGLMVLTALLLIGVVAGIQRRMAEYR